MRKQKQMYCHTCDSQRAFVARRPSGLLHTVLTIGTLGIWLMVWPFLYARNGTLYHCVICGGRPARKSKSLFQVITGR